MDSLTIRQATVADAETIVEFNILMAEETEGKRLDHAVAQSGVEAVLGDQTKGMYYVAESGGHILGQLMITYEWSDWRNGTFWWIQSVFVRETARKQGVYRALHDRIVELARRRPDVCGIRLYVDASNTRAKQTYERLGMSKSDYQFYEIDFVLGSH